MADVSVKNAQITGTFTGTISLPDPVPPEPPPNGGTPPVANEVIEGLAGASQSFPAVSGFAGYGTLFIDPEGYFRNIPTNWNGVLSIAPGAWPPGYRVPNGQNGGGYPASGTQAKGTEPIRLQPPVSGVNRVQYLTLAKILVRNEGNARASFMVGLGVANVNGPNRPISPYLGYAHDLGVWEKQMAPETLGAGDARTVTMFRVDTVDNAMDGGAANFPDWPQWAVAVDPNTKLYPAVAINFANTGTVALKVGNVFAVGVVL